MLKLITPPAAECVTLDDVIAYLHLDTDADDTPTEGITFIESMITAAISQVEDYAGIAINSQTFEYGCLPGSNSILLPMTNGIVTVNSVKTIWQCTETAFSSDNYLLFDTEAPASLSLKIGAQWPSPIDRVIINYTTGYGPDAEVPALPDIDVPARIKQAVLACVTTLYNNRDNPAASSDISPMAKALLSPYVQYADFSLNDIRYR